MEMSHDKVMVLKSKRFVSIVPKFDNLGILLNWFIVVLLEIS